MAGTRTAPTVNGTPSDLMITLHCVDASNDLYTDSMNIPPASTDADIEGYVAAYQLATNSSVWKVSVGQVYEGAKDPSNAVAAFRGGIENGINLLFKDFTANDAISPRVIAPVPATMDGNTDVPLPSDPTLQAVILAIGVLQSSYTFQSAQYTTRRERRNNPRKAT